ncbi:unnamed protein product [Dibothriocephalus latus]|uniref:Uncharacterized protein n=1 Tax=Dibothriocephalus latus TaxID=60516 RepID=A0A3P6Q9U9_DIBLA|nr:unnamed protein product [Dibothriocephalus latus]
MVFEEVDMASFASIKAFAQRILANETRIDFLINNAGIMACPYGETADGLEMQIGTNHFGHFLLTELLMPAIKKAAPGSRIICLSSIAHKKGKVGCTLLTCAIYRQCAIFVNLESLRIFSSNGCNRLCWKLLLIRLDYAIPPPPSPE